MRKCRSAEDFCCFCSAVSSLQLAEKCDLQSQTPINMYIRTYIFRDGYRDFQLGECIAYGIGSPRAVQVREDVQKYPWAQRMVSALMTRSRRLCLTLPYIQVAMERGSCTWTLSPLAARHGRPSQSCGDAWVPGLPRVPRALMRSGFRSGMAIAPSQHKRCKVFTCFNAPIK